VRGGNRLRHSDDREGHALGRDRVGNRTPSAAWKCARSREALRSTLITSQVPVNKCQQVIGELTLADVILDRLVLNAYTINLQGESMRAFTGICSRRKGGLGYTLIY
jgi:hypothetical protein